MVRVLCKCDHDSSLCIAHTTIDGLYIVCWGSMDCKACKEVWHIKCIKGGPKGPTSLYKVCSKLYMYRVNEQFKLCTQVGSETVCMWNNIYFALFFTLI